MEEQQPSPKYVEGFNKGYILREHKPDLALSLSQTKFPDTEKDFQYGFAHGIEQKEMELREGKSKSFSFSNLREQYKDELELKDTDKGRDRE